MDNETTNNNYIPLADAKASIITALNKFHPELGTRAAEILYNDDRMNVVENPSHKTGMMQCRPAGLTIEHLQKNDMHFPDYEERFGPHFTEQENNENHAIIDYEYDGSPNSVIYLAHELGHAIADDIQNENGLSYKDFSQSEAEEQAYFIQNIYSHYTGQPSAESSYQNNSDHGGLTVSWDRANQYENANGKFEKGLAMNAEERGSFIVKTLGGQTVTEEIEHVSKIETSNISTLGQD